MIRVFDIFAGYGGAEFALKKAGIEHECVGFSEIDKYAIKCFEQNHFEIRTTEEDEHMVTYQYDPQNYGDCRNINPNELPDFDLLCGGFPCQSFSVAGKGLGELDPRGTLFYEIVRIAEIKQPKYMLLENVKGLTFKTHKATFDKILSELDRIGYNVRWKVLNTRDFGIPQNRERVFFVCIRKDINQEFEFPQPTEKRLTLKDILLDEVEQKYYLTDSQLNTLQRKFGSKGECLDGRNESDTITTSMGTGGGNPKVVQIRQGHTKSNGSLIYYSENTRTLETNGNLVILNPFNGKNSTEESVTIGTSVGSTTGKTAQILIYPKKHSGETNSFRKLTPKECFRLMGFVNDEINLEGLSDTQKYKLAGNGWDINLVSLIFKEMIKDD